MDDDRTPASDRLGDLLNDGPPAAGTPGTPHAATPRPPAFHGDTAFRDDRFDDARDRAAYGTTLADEIASDADDRPLATPGTRLLAQLIDGGLAIAIYLPMLLVAGLGASFGSEPGALAVVGVAVSGLGILAYVVYQIYLLSTTGQTLGKRQMKLRIVDANDGSNPGFVRVVLLRSVVLGIVGAVPVVGGVVALGNILMIFREDRRCGHDHLAKTVVVTEAG